MLSPRNGKVRSPGLRLAHNTIETIVVSSYISGTDNLALSNPEEISEGENLGADVDDCMRRLAFSSRVSDSHSRVVTDKGDGISRRAECNTLDPACRKSARWLYCDRRTREINIPAVWFKNSPQMVLNGRRSPQTEGAGLSSTPLMKALRTRAWPSVLPKATKTLLGCQATLVTVLRSGFFKCFETHQSFSSSK
jgi:hypothetical protein